MNSNKNPSQLEYKLQFAHHPIVTAQEEKKHKLKTLC